MSIFSGKCDVYDSFGDIPNEDLVKYRFFIMGADGRKHPLEIRDQDDLARYYPYIIGVSCGYSVTISSQCFIDREEAETIDWLKRWLVRYYNKCKRLKIPYKPDEALDHVSTSSNPSNWKKELAERVGQYGAKASIEGLHTTMHDRLREEWCKHLMSIGYDEQDARRWVYRSLRMKTEEKDANKTKEAIMDETN